MSALIEEEMKMNLIRRIATSPKPNELPISDLTHSL